MEPQRQEALLEIEPDALDRIELGPIGRQRHERDILGHTQRLAAVPSRAVENERDVLVVSDRLGEGVEKHLHARAVRIRQNQREGVVRAGLYRRVDVGVHITLIEQARRSLTALPPDVADAALLPDARLVLEIEAQALVFMRTLNFLQDAQGSF